MASAALSPAPRGSRLTSRGRRFVRLARTVAIVIAALAVGIAVALSASPQAAGASESALGGTGEYSVVIVEDGDSLWSIASEVSGGVDTRDVVLDIAEINNLGAHVVHPGQRLAIPAR
ncbi:hypothetical protein GCM10022261_25480 [Brevibacterium daeguense]|uniref:LysM domain-containing protein n=1 Tax=Brevibacterium daeguense TaxID=909936 RepID=A0ABP8EM55_9MICO|nr:LysM peptidoglycan-binding domain-containing protein [Brevibacterium daeguense]